MCIHCQLNTKRKKVNKDILVRCRQNLNLLFCSDAQNDKVIQNLILLIPGLQVKGHVIAESILSLRTYYYNEILGIPEYKLEDYIKDLTDYVDVYNSVHAKPYELLPLTTLLYKERDIRVTSLYILNKISFRKRNFTRFSKKYTYVHSWFYMLLLKLRLVK